MPAAVNTSVNRGLVNWLPWSALKIPGVPKRAFDSYGASMEGSASIVFDRGQERTRRGSS